MRAGAAVQIGGWSPGRDIEGSKIMGCFEIPEETALRCYYVGREGLMPWSPTIVYQYFKDPETGIVYAQKHGGGV